MTSAVRRPARAAILAAAAWATAQTASAGQPPQTPKAAPVWTLDRAASRLSFTTGAPPEGFDGVFKAFAAEIAFDPADLPASHVTVIVQTKSVVTGDPRRDQRLPEDDALASRRFPRASFVSRAITLVGPGRYAAEGDLTLKGVSRRVSVPFALAGGRDAVTLTGRLRLGRSLFGDAGAIPPGADGVSVSFRLAAKRRP